MTPITSAPVKQVIEDGGGRLDADTMVSSGSWDAATAGRDASFQRSICA